MIIKTNVLLILILSFLTACGGGHKSTTSFEVINLAIESGQDQDAVLIGRHLKSNTTFTKFLFAGKIELDLPSGDWLFAVVAWSRTTLPTFEGKTRCKVIPKVLLNGGYMPLTFDISVAGCSDSLLFPKTAYLASPSGQLQPVTFEGCTNLTTISGPSSTCTSAGYTHYTVSLVEHRLSPLAAPIPAAEVLVSDCNSSGFTNFLLPVRSSLPLALKVRAYSDAGCTVLEKEVLFKNGLEELEGRTRLFDSINTTKVFISDADVPPIVARNTTQLHYVSANGLAPLASTTKIISLQQPNQYFGNLATNCNFFEFPSAITSIGPCTCNVSGACTASVNITNPSSTVNLNHVDFSYSLTDGIDTSNAASARMCLSGILAQYLIILKWKWLRIKYPKTRIFL